MEEGIGTEVRVHPAQVAVSKQRQLGAYYTPEAVADLLVRWALNGKIGRVLDPSFGGCSFLRSAVSVLGELGALHPGALVHGVDVDEGAWIYADSLSALGVPSRNLVLDDFFRVRPSTQESERYEALVGNPPYIRHHWFSHDMRTLAVEALERAGMEVSLRSAAWAYFVMHSMAFLRRGGRLAFLLPGALLQADYAVAVLRALEERFAGVWTIRLSERLWTEAQEETVVLLASGFGAGPTRYRFTEVSGVPELEEILKQHGAGTDEQVEAVDPKLSVLSTRANRLWDELRRRPDVRMLGELAIVNIGVVTGANSFFVRSAAECELLEGPGVQLLPVISRSKWLRTLRWERSDHDMADTASRASRLLMVQPGTCLSDKIKALLAEAEGQQLHLGSKCAGREPWYSLRDAAVPDAFLPYMGASAPHLTLNSAGVTCTNAVHRVRWKDSGETAESTTLGTWTSLFALGAELLGRSYGGGVLKLEPGRATKVPVPLAPGAKDWVDRMDTLTRQQSVVEAGLLADQVVLRDHFGLSEADIGELRTAVQFLAHRRVPSRGGS